MAELHSKFKAGDKVNYLGINVTIDKVNADMDGYWYLIKWYGESGPVTQGVREAVLVEELNKQSKTA